MKVFKNIIVMFGIFILRLIDNFGKEIYVKYYTKKLYKHVPKIGKNVESKGFFVISNYKMIEIGDNVHIGKNAHLNTHGGLFIGSNTHISRNFTVFSSSHNYSGSALPYDHTLIKKEVHIGENVWIGMNVSIIPGVTIGEGVIIGMGTTITKNVPPLSIVGGSGFKVLKSRDKEHYEFLKTKNAFAGAAGKPLV